MNMTSAQDCIDAVAWNEEGLVPAIAQDHRSGRVLMLAWMDRSALRLTLEEGRAVYYSRSRQRLWRKGEESGHMQKLIDLCLDCDGDALLLKVEQVGGIACHTGRASCFYRRWTSASDATTASWQDIDPVLKPQEDIYGSAE